MLQLLTTTVIPAVNSAALDKNHYGNYKGLCVNMPERKKMCNPAIRRPQVKY